ncbi:hypothetical protein F4803DRAFT_500465 [Xylaria telfairii]|nr:hypothetical protein F4803DRAFT_500465 [Xylaria telfairii]
MKQREYRARHSCFFIPNFKSSQMLSLSINLRTQRHHIIVKIVYEISKLSPSFLITYSFRMSPKAYNGSSELLSTHILYWSVAYLILINPIKTTFHRRAGQDGLGCHGERVPSVTNATSRQPSSEALRKANWHSISHISPSGPQVGETV